MKEKSTRHNEINYKTLTLSTFWCYGSYKTVAHFLKGKQFLKGNKFWDGSYEWTKKTPVLFRKEL